MEAQVKVVQVAKHIPRYCSYTVLGHLQVLSTVDAQFIQGYLCKDCIPQLIEAQGSSSGKTVRNEGGGDHGGGR